MSLQTPGLQSQDSEDELARNRASGPSHVPGEYSEETAEANVLTDSMLSKSYDQLIDDQASMTRNVSSNFKSLENPYVQSIKKIKNINKNKRSQL